MRYLMNTVALRALDTGGIGYVSQGTPAPTPTPTPAPVITFNGTTFANSLSTAGQWYRNGAAISGETGATYTYVEANDSGTFITQKVGGVPSNAILEGVNYIVYASGGVPQDWVGSRTPITSISGPPVWTGGGGTFYRSGSGSLIQTGNGGYGLYLLPTGHESQTIEVTVYTVSPSQVDSAQSMLAVRATNLTYWGQFAYNHGNWSMYLQNSGVTLLESYSGPALADGTKYKLAISKINSNVWLRIYQDNARVDSFGGLGYDIGALPAANNVGLVDAAVYDAVITSGDIPVQHNMTVWAYPDTQIMIASLSAFEGVLTITGAYSSPTTNIHVAFTDMSGNQLQDFYTVHPVTGGTFTTTVPMTNLDMQGTDVLVWVVDSDDHDYAVSEVFSVPYYQPPAITEWGNQHQNVANWSTEAMSAADTGPFSTWEYFNGVTHVSLPLNDTYFRPDGWPTGVMPPSGAYFIAAPLNGSQPGYGQDGSYQATWPMSGFSNPGAVAWGSGSGFTPGTIDLSAKTAAISGMTTGVGPLIILQLTPDNIASPPAGGLKLAMKRVGETATGGFSDKAIGDFPSGTWLRWMKWFEVEYPYTDSAVSTTGLFEFPWATPELVAKVADQTGTKQFIAMPINATDDWATDFATRYMASPDFIPGTEMLLELGNEVDFNTNSYTDQIAYSLNQACVEGFVAGAPAGAYDNYGGSSTAVNGFSGDTTITVYPGQRFTCSTGFHNKAVEVVSATPVAPGAHVPDQPAGYNDGTFLILAAYAELKPGSDKWRCATSIRLAGLMRTVFGSSVTLKLGYGSFLLGDTTYISSILASGGTGTEYARSINYAMPSAYVDMNFDWATAPSWLTGYADQTAFNAGLDALCYSRTASTKTTLVDYRQSLFAKLRAYSIPAASCPGTFCYEANLHLTVSSVPGGDQAGLDAAFLSYFENSLAYDMFTNYLTTFNDTGVDGVVIFAHAQTQAPSSSLSYWGLEPFVNAGSDPIVGPTSQRLLAYNDFLASL